MWHSTDADIVIYTDACPTGIGFWCPQLDCGCYGPVIHVTHTLPIFFHGASAVVCALHWLCTLHLPDVRRLVEYLDNTNTMDIFHSLRARRPYNELLKISVDILLCHDIDVCVFHISGTSNTVTDALSRQHLDLVHQLRPTMSITPSQPPAVVAEAAQL